MKRIKNLLQFWRQDILAGLSVSFVALPLSMGIALAAGYPPEAGLIAAIVGGLFAFIFGGTHIGIKGPGAGTIAALIAALIYFREEFGGSEALYILLACTFFAGVLLILTGVLKLGNYARMIPNAAISGLLAGIGFIIILTQIDDLLGYSSTASSPIDSLIEIPSKLLEANSLSIFFAFISFMILYFHKRAKGKFFNMIPSAIWVLFTSAVFVYFLGLNEKVILSLTSFNIVVDEDLLINISENMFGETRKPNFIALRDIGFWLQVLGIYFILLVENLLSAKSIDKLDPQGRQTNLNKDLSSSGFTTAISSLIGGMPSITAIARSSVNTSVGAQTRLSNFSHGLLLALMLLVAIPIINLVPRAALASILIIAGYRLCSPNKFNLSFLKGWEQLLIFIFTFYATVRYGLVFGIVSGTLLSYILPFFLADQSFGQFWRSSRSPFIKLKYINNQYIIKLKGVINFFSLLKLSQAINSMPKTQNLQIDLSETKLVDNTILEFFSEEQQFFVKSGRELELMGLENHKSSSPHPHALQLKNTTWKRSTVHTPRQISLARFANLEGYKYSPAVSYDMESYHSFNFFRTRPLEYSYNHIQGKFPKEGDFCVSDMYFQEGELGEQSSLLTTILIFPLDKPLPSFRLEHYSFYNKLKVMASRGWDFVTHFQTKNEEMQLSAEDKVAVQEVFSEELINILGREKAYFIECNGKEILLLNESNLANLEELKKLIRLGAQLKAFFSKFHTVKL